MDYEVTREQLENGLFEEQVIQYAEKEGCRLLVLVDLFNSQITWEIEELYGDGVFYTDFLDSTEAFEYFLTCQEED